MEIQYKRSHSSFFSYKTEINKLLLFLSVWKNIYVEASKKPKQIIVNRLIWLE